MSKASQRNYVLQYPAKMYEASNSGNLRTGDVVRLELDDLEKIVRYKSVLELFRHFDENSEYSPKLWAILNKTCDMVHDPAKGRYFKSNLFLVPLQILRTALRKGTLGDLLYSEDLIAPENLLTDAYKKYFSKKARYKNPYDSAISQKQYYVDLNKTVIDPAVDKIKELIEGQVNEIDSPSELLNGLIKLTESDEEIQEDLKSFKESDEWQEELNKYNKKQKEVQEKNTKGNLFLNILLRFHDFQKSFFQFYTLQSPWIFHNIIPNPVKFRPKPARFGTMTHSSPSLGPL